MHGLDNTFYFERKKNIHAIFLLYLFIGICVPQSSFSGSADFLTAFFCGKALAIVTKCSALDVAEVLNALQYAPT